MIQKYDESLAILKGQADAHQKQIADLEFIIINHEKAIAVAAQQIETFKARIHFLNEAHDNLLAIKAKEVLTDAKPQ